MRRLGYDEISHILLERGADPRAKTPQGAPTIPTLST